MCLDLRNGTLQEKTLSETEFQHSVTVLIPHEQG